MNQSQTFGAASSSSSTSAQKARCSRWACRCPQFAPGCVSSATSSSLWLRRQSQAAVEKYLKELSLRSGDVVDEDGEYVLDLMSPAEKRATRACKRCYKG